MDIILARVAKNTREELRVTRRSTRGRTMIHVRVWERERDGSFRDTPRGVAIAPENVQAVIEGLLRAALCADVDRAARRS